jgi:hypothetical protein
MSDQFKKIIQNKKTNIDVFNSDHYITTNKK